MGQSNMSGRGFSGEVSEIRHPGILNFREGVWNLAEEPLHLDKPKAGIGLGMSFASELISSGFEAPIGFLPCAVGGTPPRSLDAWRRFI